MSRIYFLFLFVLPKQEDLKKNWIESRSGGPEIFDSLHPFLKKKI